MALKNTHVEKIVGQGRRTKLGPGRRPESGLGTILTRSRHFDGHCSREWRRRGGDGWGAMFGLRMEGGKQIGGLKGELGREKREHGAGTSERGQWGRGGGARGR